MEQIEANNEILYQLSKMMLINLVKNGYLEKEEAENMRRWSGLVCRMIP